MGLKTEERLSSFLDNYADKEERSRVLELMNSWEANIGLLLTKEQVSDYYGDITDKMIELPTGVDVTLYPEFQFDCGHLLNGLVEVYNQFDTNVIGPWSLASYLNTPQPELKEKTPIEWLKSNGDLEYLLQIVRGYNSVLSI
jgi:hypothetical protein